MQIQGADGPRRALVCSDLDLVTRYDLNTLATTAPEGVKFTIVADASNASELLPHPPVNGADTKVPPTPPLSAPRRSLQFWPCCIFYCPMWKLCSATRSMQLCDPNLLQPHPQPTLAT